MGTVECIELEGYDLKFYSSDHWPPHFHCAKSGEWEIRVFILSTTEEAIDMSIKWGDGPKSKVRRTLRDLVLKHREQLLMEWEQKVNY